MNYERRIFPCERLGTKRVMRILRERSGWLAFVGVAIGLAAIFGLPRLAA
jgi:hypothetical protein